MEGRIYVFFLYFEDNFPNAICSVITNLAKIRWMWLNNLVESLLLWWDSVSAELKEQHYPLRLKTDVLGAYPCWKNYRYPDPTWEKYTLSTYSVPFRTLDTPKATELGPLLKGLHINLPYESVNSTVWDFRGWKTRLLLISYQRINCLFASKTHILSSTVVP